MFPRYSGGELLEAPAPASSRRAASVAGVPGLDELFGGRPARAKRHAGLGQRRGSARARSGCNSSSKERSETSRGSTLALEEAPRSSCETRTTSGCRSSRQREDGLVELVYLRREHARAGQLLAILDDKIRAQRTRRLVIDGVSQLARISGATEDLRELLRALAVRFKSHGVTSIFTLESESMYSTEVLAERGYAPIVDNIVMLRYERMPGEVRPNVAVVKSRGSLHEWGTYAFTIAQGGLRVGRRVDQDTRGPKVRGRPRKRVKR